MATNFYFNNFPQNNITSEQLLVEDLAIEAMQISGMDVYYLARSNRDGVSPDSLYGEDTLKQFRHCYAMEMYMENVSGMDGDGDFISKFGLEIRDEVTMLVSRRRFATTVPLIHPREGDLVYIPLVQNFFEITYVEHENDQAMFYTLGRGRGANVYVFALKMKQYVFSEELIETGLEEVDSQAFDAYKRTSIALANTGTGLYIPTETVYQGTSLDNATAQATVYSFKNNYQLELVLMQGYFTPGHALVGATSNASWTMATVDETTQTGDNVFEDLADNKTIQTESSVVLDFSESNPFGEP